MTSLRIPSHTIDSIVTAAKEIPSAYKIPNVPPELLSAIFRNYEGSDVEDDDTNERFYVDETNMVERRFLKEATDMFETARDIDPFASSSLFKNLLDCALAHPSLKSMVSSLTTQQFLSGGGSSSEDGMLSLASQLCDETTFETGRLRYQKEHPSEYSQDAVSVLVDSSQDIYNRVKSLGFLTGNTFVIEDDKGCTRIVGPSPRDGSEAVYWIRGVVDGWLGIMMSAKDAEQRFKDTGITRYNPDPEQNGSPLLRHKKVRVSTLRDVYEHITGVKPGKLKKAELVYNISEKCLWGIHIPELMSVIG
jgi:hypothetical protein